MAPHCPHCRHALSGSTEQLECAGCGRHYPVLLGIPDLRVADGPYISNADDWAKARRIVAESSRRSFAELVALYYELTPEVPAADARRYTRALLSGAPRAVDTLDSWAALAGHGIDPGCRVVEVGCGTGALLAELTRRGAQAVGIDVSLRWLVIAQRRLEEAGVAVPLVCANAEALPLSAESCDRVALDSALEHFRDGAQAIREAARVLTERGELWIATPNRLSLGPDPHLGIWAGGLWPDAVTRRIAARRGALAPARHLLSVGELTDWLTAGGFRRPRVGIPAISSGQREGLSAPARALAGGYNRLRGLGALRPLLLRLGPVLHAVAARERGSA